MLLARLSCSSTSGYSPFAQFSASLLNKNRASQAPAQVYGSTFPREGSEMSSMKHVFPLPKKPLSSRKWMLPEWNSRLHASSRSTVRFESTGRGGRLLSLRKSGDSPQLLSLQKSGDSPQLLSTTLLGGKGRQSFLSPWEKLFLYQFAVVSRLS